jgi:ribosomal protein S18 acetylase RimI-like enzyme
MTTMLIRSESLEIRSVTPADNDAILDVYRQCEDFLALGIDPHASMALVLKDIEASQQERGVFCGIYHAHGGMIGVVEFVPGRFEGNPHVAFLSLLMIAAPFRGQGIGREVVRLVEREIGKDSQVTTILSAVQVNNPSAQRFWQNCGYRIVGGPELRPDHTTVFRLQKNVIP